MFVPEEEPLKLDADIVPETTRFAVVFVTGIRRIALYTVAPLGVNLQRHSSLLLSSVRLKSKKVLVPDIVVLIDALSED